jgi:hypothetical protein
LRTAQHFEAADVCEIEYGGRRTREIDPVEIEANARIRFETQRAAVLAAQRVLGDRATAELGLAR